ncbi:hypothetical protein MN0502_35310 (plasmid) [Arthrobacter sp. MN05-02]|nr:hypothetical protein MN0502_35310 [Arthrobacter sp. MN05-02]
MTTTSVRTPPPVEPGSRSPWLTALALRIHFYAAIFVGPFLLIAALSGAMYALTPQLEKIVYAEELIASDGPAVPLEEQIQAAQQHLNTSDLPTAVRPGPDGETTRVMFSDPTLGESETRAVFVDPATADVTGETTAYGTSGSSACTRGSGSCTATCTWVKSDACTANSLPPGLASSPSSG